MPGDLRCVCALVVCQTGHKCETVRCAYCGFQGACRVDVRREKVMRYGWTDVAYMECRKTLGGCGHASRDKTTPPHVPTN